MISTLLQRVRSRHFTLDMYLGRRFLFLAIADLFVFCMIYVLVDSLNQLDHFVEAADDFFSLLGVAFSYYYHTLPGLYCQILGPVVTMASALFTVTITARANEFADRFEPRV